MMTGLPTEQAIKIEGRLRRLYGERAPQLIERLQMILGRYGVGVSRGAEKDRWSESDAVLITYADSIQREGETPLATLHEVLVKRIKGAINTVHLLPFCPWTSDDGFSVVDYREVDDRYGSWSDIDRLGGDFQLMFDLVLNHCSAESEWFKDFVKGVAPARNYFHSIDPDTDLSGVTRPRPTPLLTETTTRRGVEHVWTTFSADQVDLNWEDPDLLFEFIDILFFYFSKSCRILRLDAVAFLWKEIGTTCLHLPETHEVVKLFRDLFDLVAPSGIVLTETNVPHDENMSYFGDGDEAHMVYNFSLPPLLLYSLLKGDCTPLREWAIGLPSLPEDQAFFNFTASHDGIGVRPLQGLVEDSEVAWLADEIRTRGGQVSTRATPTGEVPYELNCSYVDALSVPENSALGLSRYLCSQAVMLAFRGMPAVYIHSLLGTSNWTEGFAETGRNRTLNRRQWQWDDLKPLLDDVNTQQGKVFACYTNWLSRRKNQPAFHPDAPMQILRLADEGVFGLVRSSLHRDQTIVCVFNFTAQKKRVPFGDLHPGLAFEAGTCRNVLSGGTIKCGDGRALEMVPYGAYWLALQ